MTEQFTLVIIWFGSPTLWSGGVEEYHFSRRWNENERNKALFRKVLLPILTASI